MRAASPGNAAGKAYGTSIDLSSLGTAVQKNPATRYGHGNMLCVD